MQMGAGLSDALVAAPRATNASLSRHEGSLVSGSTQKNAASMDAAITMRRLFGSHGGATCHGILVAGVANQEASAAYRKALIRLLSSRWP